MRKFTDYNYKPCSNIVHVSSYWVAKLIHQNNLYKRSI